MHPRPPVLTTRGVKGTEIQPWGNLLRTMQSRSWWWWSWWTWGREARFWIYFESRVNGLEGAWICEYEGWYGRVKETLSLQERASVIRHWAIWRNTKNDSNFSVWLLGPWIPLHNVSQFSRHTHFTSCFPQSPENLLCSLQSQDFCSTPYDTPEGPLTFIFILHYSRIDFLLDNFAFSLSLL